MRKYLFIAMAALAMIACSKEEVKVEKNTQPLKFSFNIAEKPSFDADTKSVKTSWEDGDKIYIVFDDAVPTSLEDFMILKYSASAEDWEVFQESTTAPKEDGGTLDALYYENPDPDGYLREFESGNIYIFDRDISQGGRYMFLDQKDAPYTVKEGNVKASISLDFDPNKVRTYTQFCITGLEGDWNIMNSDLFNSDNDFGVWTPAWSEFSKSFQYEHFGDSGFKMNERADGHYGYFTMFQNADEITITLYKTSGENAGLYWKTFSKKISGKSAAITFKGPQLNSDGVPTNGWNKVGDSGSIAGHDYVDLGGDVLWATTNVGADGVFDKGDFFAWGETEPHYSSLDPLVWKEGKTGYNYHTYSLLEVVEMETETGPQELLKFLKYQGTGDELDGLTTLTPADDAASFNWGYNWRTPTETDWEWLIENCTFRSLANSSTIVSSTVAGYEDHFIIIPHAGTFADQDFKDGSSYYMSSSLSSNRIDTAVGISVAGQTIMPGIPRYSYGLPVRPVIDKE